MITRSGLVCRDYDGEASTSGVARRGRRPRSGAPPSRRGRARSGSRGRGRARGRGAEPEEVVEELSIVLAESDDEDSEGEESRPSWPRGPGLRSDFAEGWDGREFRLDPESHLSARIIRGYPIGESLRKKKNKADEGNPVMCDGLRKRLYGRLRLDRFSRDPNGFECRPDTHYWIKAESIANNLVQEFKDKMESPPVAPIILKELRVEVMSGYRYRMHFQVTHEKGITSNYYAKAWIPPGPPEKVGVEYMCLERVIRPGNSKKEKKVVTLFTTEPPLTLNENVFNGIDEGTIELLFGKNKHRLRALGFNLLLKEIKDQSMECETYAKVRKRASRKWREIGEVKRLCYMRDVAVKREEEWFKENNGLSVMHST